MKLKGKKVLVVGLGLQGGGLATVRWLLHQRARVSVTDLKNRRQLESSLKNLGHLPIKFVLGKHPLSLLRGVDLVVQNPAVPNSLPLIRRAERLGIPIEGEASIFLKMCPAPVIAVTGSKGKSTVASWLGFMFKNAGYHTMVAGNIRDRLMLSILPNINPNTKVVLELSSWQLENLGRFKLSPPLAVITNILPDHLDRYKNMSQYAQAKANIWRWQSKSDKAVLNWDNIITRKLGRLAQSKIFWFSTQAKVSVGDRETRFFGMEHGMDRNPPVNIEVGLGETAKVTVNFDPAAHGPEGVGPFDRVVWLAFSDPAGVKELKFSGVVVKD